MEKEVTATDILAEEPNAIILATGGKQFVPKVPGISKSHVVMGLDVLKGNEVGKRVIVVGGNMGAELGWFLLDQKPDRSIVITTMEEIIASDIEVTHRVVLMKKLDQSRVKMYTRVSLKEVTDSGVIMRRNLGELGEEIPVVGESVVLMCGFTPNRELAEALSKESLQIFFAGDCIHPRGIHEAIYEGHLAARAIE
jgi:2,4-dienoyl-CoA reductase (NADPH2)